MDSPAEIVVQCSVDDFTGFTGPLPLPLPERFCGNYLLFGGQNLSGTFRAQVLRTTQVLRIFMANRTFDLVSLFRKRRSLLTVCFCWSVHMFVSMCVGHDGSVVGLVPCRFESHSSRHVGPWASPSLVVACSVLTPLQYQFCSRKPLSSSGREVDAIEISGMNV